jgi:hypothetical protein
LHQDGNKPDFEAIREKATIMAEPARVTQTDTGNPAFLERHEGAGGMASGTIIFTNERRCPSFRDALRPTIAG